VVSDLPSDEVLPDPQFCQVGSENLDHVDCPPQHLARPLAPELVEGVYVVHQGETLFLIGATPVGIPIAEKVVAHRLRVAVG